VKVEGEGERREREGNGREKNEKKGTKMCYSELSCNCSKMNRDALF
jgi:hypothetical protein